MERRKGEGGIDMAMSVLILYEKGPHVGFKMRRQSDILFWKKMALQNMLLFSYKVKKLFSD